MLPPASSLIGPLIVHDVAFLNAEKIITLRWNRKISEFYVFSKLVGRDLNYLEQRVSHLKLRDMVDQYLRRNLYTLIPYSGSKSEDN